MKKQTRAKNHHQNQYILTVDLGTSGPKSALISVSGEWIDFEFATNDVLFLENSGAEQNPKDWYLAILNTWKIIRKRHPSEWKNVIGISVTTQWSGTVAVDKNGNPLMNAMIWLDSRGEGVTRKKFRGLFNIEDYSASKLWKWIRKTGGIASHSGKDSLSHILYIKYHYPNLYEDTYKFLEVKDYINFLFTGEYRATYDSIALHWITDNRKIDDIHYDESLIRELELDREKFPDLIHSTDLVGKISKKMAQKVGLPENVMVFGGSPDMQSAAIGSGSFTSDVGHVYIGTSSWVSTHVDFKKTDLFHNIASLPSGLPGKYFIPATQETAGAVMKHFRERVLYHSKSGSVEKKDFFKMIDEAGSSALAGSNGLIFTPWMYGERAPVEKSHLRATHWNLSLNTGFPEYVRSMMEGIAMNQRWLLRYVEKFVGSKFQKIHFIGGGSHSPVMAQILADGLNRSIYQIKDGIRANLLGAFIIAMIGISKNSIDPTEFIEIKNIFEPNPENISVYDDLFEKYIYLYKQSDKIYKKLNRS